MKPTPILFCGALAACAGDGVLKPRSAEVEVAGYERPGCDPLGPYESRVLDDPNNNAKPCLMSDRVAKVRLGSFGFTGDDDDMAVVEELRPNGTGGGPARP